MHNIFHVVIVNYIKMLNQQKNNINISPSEKWTDCPQKKKQPKAM